MARMAGCSTCLCSLDLLYFSPIFCGPAPAFVITYQHSKQHVGDQWSSDDVQQLLVKQPPVALIVLAQAFEALNAVSMLLCNTGEPCADKSHHAGALAPLALMRV